VAQAVFAFEYVAARNRWQFVAVRRDHRAFGLVLSYLAAFALWAPWLPVLLSQRRQVGASFWLPPMSWWLVGKTAYQMFAPSQYTIRPSWAAGLAAAACAAAFTALLWLAGPGDWFIEAEAVPGSSSHVVSGSAPPDLDGLVDRRIEYSEGTWGRGDPGGVWVGRPLD